MPIIELRSRISRPDNGNDRCDKSNRPDKRSDSCRSTYPIGTPICQKIKERRSVLFSICLLTGIPPECPASVS